MVETQGDAEMAWIDLETTGLSAKLDVPLELGMKLTDRYGYPLASASWLIWEDNAEFQASVKRGRENEFVNDLHTKSGLWDALDDDEFPPMTRKQVDSAVCDWLADNGVRYGTLPMCGNSIGSLDRPFALVHLPMLNETLSYRNIDMSSFKEVCKLVNPELYEKLKPIIGTKENAEHRVLSDIDASILEYRAYLDNFLFTTLEG